MLENITQKLGSVFDKIRGRGALTEKDVDATLSEVRKALLEADVAIEAVKVFIENTRKRAVGTEVLRSITPGQMVVKVVHDELVILLGNDEDASLNIDHSPPATILLAGLQGSGKTTTAGKLALWIKNKKNKKVLDKIYINIATFYSINTANFLKERITKELTSLDFSKLKVKKINNNETSVILGPYTTINSLKNDYIKLKDYGFEELDIFINE